LAPPVWPFALNRSQLQNRALPAIVRYDGFLKEVRYDGFLKEGVTVQECGGNDPREDVFTLGFDGPIHGT
jgi:hypothetical protein